MDPELEKHLTEFTSEQVVTEKYQAFSAELLRVSLIGIAILGFFVDKVSTLTVFARQAEHGCWG